MCVWFPTSRVPHTKDGAGSEVSGALPWDAARGQTNRSVSLTLLQTVLRYGVDVWCSCWWFNFRRGFNFCACVFVFNMLYARHGHTERSYRQFNRVFQQRGLDSGSPECGRCYRHHQQRQGQTHICHCRPTASSFTRMSSTLSPDFCAGKKQ